MSIKITINKISDVFGIRQSNWNLLRQSNPGPAYFYYKNESDLRTVLRLYADISNKKCTWNFQSIGHHCYDSGFFGKGYYVSCSNCSDGVVSGDITAELAKINIVKESSDPANPKSGFFSSDILEENFVLWNIRLDMKCNRCEKHTVWDGVREANGLSWGFSNFKSSFARCQ